MSRLQEIKSSIGSVKSTKKITRAYYLISAAKSKKAKSQLETIRPYFNSIAACISELLASSTDIDTPYLGHRTETEGKGKLYLVLSGDKGMAGAYNHNILNMLDSSVNKETDSVLVVGYMGYSQILRQGYAVDEDFRYQIMNPTVNRAREITEIIVNKYLSNAYREVHIVYTTMVTPIKQVPVSEQLLPLAPFEHVATGESTDARRTILYEPSAKEVFDHLVPHYLKGIVYDALVEAFASEQHARMYAMDNATSNADDMISNLTLRYNRARQAAITQEISEIVGGIPAE